jgi:hypothetical protein
MSMINEWKRNMSRRQNKCKNRPVGTIKVTDPRGYVYLPKLLIGYVGVKSGNERKIES